MALTQIPPVMIDGELGLDWQSSVETSSFTAVTGKGYFVNTTNAGITVTMPSSPIAGDSIGIIDYAGTASTNTITLSSSNNIEGSSSEKIVNYTRGAIRISYSDATQGWLVSAAANEGTSALNPAPFEVHFLVVAGGGGGGKTYYGGGGGGAGGLRTSYAPSGGGANAESPLLLLPANNYTITVGDGGPGMSNGNNSSITGASINDIESTGGGYGGNGTSSPQDGGSGGSGGGGGTGVNGPGYGENYFGGAGTLNEGFDGARNAGTSGSPPTVLAGGGGGASQTPAIGLYYNSGGNGLAVNILNATNAATENVGEVSGNDVYYAGGGAGGGRTSSYGSGGTGGGATGVSNNNVGNDGTPNTGGGGSGASSSQTNNMSGGAGGSGVVILRYPSSLLLTNPGGGLTLNTYTESNKKVTVFKSGSGTIQLN